MPHKLCRSRSPRAPPSCMARRPSEGPHASTAFIAPLCTPYYYYSQPEGVGILGGGLQLVSCLPSCADPVRARRRQPRCMARRTSQEPHAFSALIAALCTPYYYYSQPAGVAEPRGGLQLVSCLTGWAGPERPRAPPPSCIARRPSQEPHAFTTPIAALCKLY